MVLFRKLCAEDDFVGNDCGNVCEILLLHEERVNVMKSDWMTGFLKPLLGLSVLIMMLFLSCKRTNSFDSGGGEDLEKAKKDTVLASDSLTEEAVEDVPVPKSADEYFNDFIYSFTSNRRYQYSRIVFPLPYDRFGEKRSLDRKEWSFSRMHNENVIYTVFFDKESSLDLEKSRKVDEVTIEWFFMKKKYVQDFFFSRIDGKWKLRRMSEYGLENYPDKEFVLFYQRFATDSLFQENHLSAEIFISVPDPDDDFETMTGTIGKEQWEAFKPELPRDVFTNIRYGQSLGGKKHRVVAIEGSSNGFLTLLFFKKTDGEWKLYKLKG